MIGRMSNGEKEFEGNSLEDAILSQGYDPSYISEQKPTLSQAQIDAIHAHVELHIEQAKSLEVNGLDIGIVSSIRGRGTLSCDCGGGSGAFGWDANGS